MLTATLTGVQTPRIEHVPPYVSSAGEEAIEFCESFGLFLDPWQQHILTHSLGERKDNRWAAFEVGLLVSRQNGKGSVLEAREMAGLFLFDDRLILHSAHEFKTAQEAFLRVTAHIEGNAFLRRRVKRIRTSHGEESVDLTSGARLRFVARTRNSGRGFTADTIIFDEAYNLDTEGVSAMLPTLSAVPNPQVWYTSSAGMETSDQLRQVRERGLAGGEAAGDLAYFEWSAEPGVDLSDRDAWTQSNPALGYRITEETIARERAAMDDLGFARERLGIWFDPSTVDRVIPLQTWAALADPQSQVCDPVVFAVDATPDRTAAAISVAGRRADGLGHVEIVESGPGTGWLLDRIVRLHERHKPRAWLLDPRSSAGSLLPDLHDAGIEPERVSGMEMTQACGAFFEAAVEKSGFRHLDQASLNNALAGAKKRPTGDAWYWHRRNSDIDISPLVAATLAWHGFAKFGSQEEVVPWVAWA